VLFEIEYTRACPGVDVSVLSVFPGEKEVLFAPCTGLSFANDQPASAVLPTGGLSPRCGLGAGRAHVKVLPAAAHSHAHSSPVVRTQRSSRSASWIAVTTRLGRAASKPNSDSSGSPGFQRTPSQRPGLAPEQSQPPPTADAGVVHNPLNTPDRTMKAAGAVPLAALDWTAHRVAQEVCAIGKGFEQYERVFIDNGLDGRTLLDVTDDDLRDCGITNGAHLKRLRRMIVELAAPPVTAAAGRSS